MQDLAKDAHLPGAEDGKGAPRERWKKSWRFLWQTALAFAIGIAGAATFLHFALPLPWFLGSLSFCLFASIFNAPIRRPMFISVPVRAILGVAVGTAFTPALFGRMGSMVSSLLILIPFMAGIMLAGMFYFSRVARFDRPTAFFCGVPGGLADMVTMAEDAGANVRAVTLIQATRILMLVFFLPLWLQATSGYHVGGLSPRGVHLSQFTVRDAVVLVVLAAVGWQLAKRIGLAGAPLVGPMLLSGIAHAAGLTEAKMPIELLIVAQVSLGIMLGAQFRGLTAREFASTVLWGVGFSAVLIALTAVMALFVSRITGFDSATVLLAYAPGGQAELNLLAFILGLDVAFTAMHHLVRLAIAIFGAQLVFRTNRHWRVATLKPGDEAGREARQEPCKSTPPAHTPPNGPHPG
ncbi:MAG: AbrB family transcriptional regulator [Hyphomicrobiaceae bacterium]